MKTNWYDENIPLRWKHISVMEINHWDDDSSTEKSVEIKVKNICHSDENVTHWW